MAGFLSIGNDQYIGTLTLNTAGGVAVGAFVQPLYATGTCIVPTSTAEGDGDVLFVQNEIDTVFEDMKDDSDYLVKNGKFVKGHVPQKGDIMVTTNYTGTPANGAIMAVGVGGGLVAIGARTPKFSFTVRDNADSFYGLPAIKVVVE